MNANIVEVYGGGVSKKGVVDPWYLANSSFENRLSM